MLDDRDTNIFLISWSFSSKQHIQHLPDWIWLSFEFNLAGHKHGVGSGGGCFLRTIAPTLPSTCRRPTRRILLPHPTRTTEHAFVGAIMCSRAQKHMDSL